MKTPPLLLGASLLFWGWQTEHLLLAILVALCLEGSFLVKSKFDFSPSDFNRLSDLCSLLFLGMFFYINASKRFAEVILVLLQWLPLTFLPLLVAQVYSTSEKIDISALFLVMRRKKRKVIHPHPTTLNLTYPYFALCLLSASAANVRTPIFYVGLLVLSSWALWTKRSKRFSPILWITLLIFSGLLGYGGQVGLHTLQVTLEQKAMNWFTGFMGKDGDPYRATTAIGDIGTLKLSDRIVLRVWPETGHAPPTLLREASYNAYRSSRWFASNATFKAVQHLGDGVTWELGPDPGAEKIFTVSASLKGGKGLLTLPNGAFEVSQLPVLEMHRNQLGATRVEDGPGLINYRVRFDLHTSLDAPPDRTDLRLPKKERRGVFRVSQRLGLNSQSPREILKRVEAFFQNNFKYSLVLKRPLGSEGTPLQNFLHGSRSGHCEYFATATVLLLRAAGLPARYATGYSVQEYSGLEKGFIVRARHAHAWALVYLNGTWQDFDTTPSSWVGIEEQLASPLQPLFDLWSFGLFKFSQWRWGEKKVGVRRFLWWTLLLLLALLAFRLFTRKWVRSTTSGREERGDVEVKRGADSPFYLIEKRLNESGHLRPPWEALSTWLKKVEETRSPPLPLESLESMLTIHYRYRFDPKGISGKEKEELKTKVQSWLEMHDRTNAHS